MRLVEPPSITDDTFTLDAPTRSFSVNVPRLYCETIGAPVTGAVIDYCLDRKGWRRKQLLHLADRLEAVIEPPSTVSKANETTLADVVHRCRVQARAMLEDDDITLWTPMDDERVLEEVS